jgi:hypothetical protein
VSYPKTFKKIEHIDNTEYSTQIELYNKLTTYCELKNEESLQDFFQFVMNDTSITNGQKKVFAYHSSYCFSNEQFIEMKSFLQDHLVETDQYVYALVPIFDLDSIMNFEELPPLNVLFNEINESLISGYNISLQNKEYLRLYAVLANLDRIEEDLYLDGILNLFSEFFQKYPAYIDDFSRLVLEHSLELLISKNSVLKSLLLLDEKYSNDYSHKTNNSHSPNQDNHIHDDIVSTPLYIDYYVNCILPKIIVHQDSDYNMVYYNYEENLMEIKNIILTNDRIEWKYEN